MSLRERPPAKHPDPTGLFPSELVLTLLCPKAPN
jgi:hypothetical protein